VNLTPSQLSTYDGSNPDLPIYLAINGTIFDVSAGRRTYGPGGSYSVFAGRDATRAFVTGCFLEDTTDDMRGAELIYIPVDDEEEVIGSAERKTRAERERREAKKKVRQEVQKWEDFYRNSKKYFEVGKLIRQDKHRGPPPELCESAMKSRSKRTRTKRATASAEGKPV
jgi:predicted heme/steroid binding protein